MMNKTKTDDIPDKLAVVEQRAEQYIEQFAQDVQERVVGSLVPQLEPRFDKADKLLQETRTDLAELNEGLLQFKQEFNRYRTETQKRLDEEGEVCVKLAMRIDTLTSNGQEHAQELQTVQIALKKEHAETREDLQRHREEESAARADATRRADVLAEDLIQLRTHHSFTRRVLIATLALFATSALLLGFLFWAQGR